MNIYYMPKPRYKKDYKRIDKLEQKFAPDVLVPQFGQFFSGKSNPEP